MKKFIERFSQFDQRGFTLLEMLIAMGIFIILMGALMGSFITFGRSNTSESARATAQQSSRSGIEIMIQDIRHAGLDPHGTGSFGFIPTPTATDVEFTADRNLDGILNNTDLERIRYLRSGNQIIQRLYGDSSTDLAVMDNVTDLTFIYRDVDNNETTIINDIETVEISLTVQENSGYGRTVTRGLSTRVSLRN